MARLLAICRPVIIMARVGLDSPMGMPKYTSGWKLKQKSLPLEPKALQPGKHYSQTAGMLSGYSNTPRHEEYSLTETWLSPGYLASKPLLWRSMYGWPTVDRICSLL